MDSLISNPYVVTIAGDFVVAIVVAIVVGITTKSWPRFKPHLLTLAKKLDRPVVMKRSRYIQHLHAIEERHKLYVQLKEEKSRNKKSETHIENLRNALQEKIDTWANADILLETIVTERNDLRNQVSRLSSENKTLKNKSVGKITGKVGETCSISGHYQSQCHQDIQVFFNYGDVFTPCYGRDGDPHDTTWVLAGP